MKRSKSLTSGVNDKLAVFSKRESSPSNFTVPPTVPPKPSREVRSCLSMKDLCSKMKNELPMKLFVTQGTYGVTPESTFSEDELLTAHFVQTIDHVVLRPFDSCERPFYRIPLNSSILISIIYNPKKKLDEALTGYVFPSPSHLMKSDPANMPRLVAVIKEHVDNSNPQYSVELNDVLLIVKQVKDGKKRILECIHVMSGLKKFIKEDSNVKLSTRPKQVSLTLKTIVQYVHLPIEVLVMIPPSPELTAGRTLVGMLSERSKILNIICTRAEYHSDDNSNSQQQLYAIPELFELDCRKLKYSEKEREALCLKTVEYLETFDPRLVNYDIPTLYACLPHDIHPSSVQSVLYSSVYCVKDNGITCPEKLRRYFPLKYLSTKKVSSASQGTSIENRVQLLEETVQALFNEIRILKEQIGRRSKQDEQCAHDDSKTSKCEGIAEDLLAELQKAILDLQKHNDQVSGKIDVLTDTVAQLQQPQDIGDMDSDSDGGYQPLIPASKNVRKSSCSQSSNNSKKQLPLLYNNNNPQTISSVNRQYLMSLTAEEVGKFLVQLNMEHHKAMFLSENITGDKLAHFSKIDFLKLKVSEQSERDKLLQFITGQESVFPFML